MSFDDVQANWQAHDHPTRLNIDADLLLKEVSRNHRSMESALIQRDLAEVIAAAIVTGGFGCLAVLMREWSLFLCAAGGLFVGAFFVADRFIQRRRRAVPGVSLHSYIQASLAQVDHQIWLLRNIFWWYLLPLVPGIFAFLASLAWKTPRNGTVEQLIIASVGAICVASFWLAYRINLRAVKNTFEPRRIELEALFASLKQEPE